MCIPLCMCVYNKKKGCCEGERDNGNEVLKMCETETLCMEGRTGRGKRGGGVRIQDMMDNLRDEWSGSTSCSVLAQCVLVV